MSAHSEDESTAWVPLPDHEARVQKVRTQFRIRYGTDPDGVWSAPGRLNLLGEYVDFNGGVCLPTPLPYRTLVAGRLRSDGILHAESLQMQGDRCEAPIGEIAPGTVQGWFSYVAGVAWAMNQDRGADIALPTGFGADLLIDSTVPVGGGLSSSAALLSATVLALLELSCPLRAGSEVGPLPVGGCGPDNDDLRRRLAEVCMLAENRVAGANTGALDHTAALRSLPGEAMAVDFRDMSIEPIPVDPSAQGLEFLVIDTRAPHDLADGQYARRREACEAVASAVGVGTLRELLPPRLGFPELTAEEARSSRKRLIDDALHRVEEEPRVHSAAEGLGLNWAEVRGWIRHVFTDMLLVARARALLLERQPLGEETWRELGGLFTLSHASMRDDLGASRAELDVAVATCLSGGALGARLVGGGFGGAVLALVPAGRSTAVAAMVSATFNDHGFNAPAFLPLAPGRPAARDL